MTLQGSLDTFALADVLVLLATTKKTGELHVVGDRATGSLWVEKGQLVAATVGKPCSVVDGVFELLRLNDGTFDFHLETKAPDGRGEPLAVEPALAEAETRLLEWREIEKVVPSLSALVRLVPEAPAPEFKVRAEQWRLVAAIGGGRPVMALGDALGSSEFDTCRAVKDLVDTGLARVEVNVAVPEPVLEPAGSSEPPAELNGEPRKPRIRRPSGETAEAAPAPGGRRPARADAEKADPTKAAEAAEGIKAGAAKAAPAKAEPAKAEPAKAGPMNGQPASDEPAKADRPAGDGASPEVAAVRSATKAPAAGPAAVLRQLAQAEQEAEAEGRLATGRATAAEAAALAVAAQDDPEVQAALEAAAEAGPDGEPINRGLLLKFLSSVRS